MPSKRPRITVYLTPEEHAQISEYATRAGLSLSTFAKRVCTGAAVPTLEHRQAVKDILKANAAAADSGVGLGNARMARNKALYADKTSLCERAAGVKAYVRSLFGVSSAEYRRISGLQFVKVR